MFTVTISFVQILPSVRVKLSPMLQQTDLYGPVMECMVIAIVLYFNFSNLKYSVHKNDLLIHSVFTLHCMCVKVCVL
jgi:hypothetical protein